MSRVEQLYEIDQVLFGDVKLPDFDDVVTWKSSKDVFKAKRLLEASTIELKQEPEPSIVDTSYDLSQRDKPSTFRKKAKKVIYNRKVSFNNSQQSLGTILQRKKTFVKKQVLILEQD